MLLKVLKSFVVLPLMPVSVNACLQEGFNVHTSSPKFVALAQYLL
jgi:hypothetical protein